MKSSSSSKKKRNNKYQNSNNYDFNTGYSLNSSNLNETGNVSSSSSGGQSTATGGASDIDLDAGQENEPADGRIYYRNKNKQVGYLNKTCDSRPTTESTMLSSSPSMSDNENSLSLHIDQDESEEEEEEEEEEIEVDDDGSDVRLATQDITNITKTTTPKKNQTVEFSDNESNCLMNNDDSYMDKFDQDYDGQVEKIADKATAIISDGSFFDCGLYQFISFLFVSIAWTIGNGWYAYVSVFSGYTPEFECDVQSMGSNMTMHPVDKECSVLNILTNETVKCTKWIYDKSQLTSTIITEFDLVCDKNYYFELAYSVEQIGYIVGTLIFSFIADKVGRKPVFVGVIIGMSLLGIIQYFVIDLIIYFIIGFVINSLACGLEAVCVTLVLEMFSTSKRTLFGIGIEVVWVITLASMSPLAYLIQTWREIRLVIFFVLTLLSLGSFWMVQESIRWLISVEKIDKAEVIVDRIAKYNNLTNSKKTKYSINKECLNTMFSQLSVYNKSQTDQPKIVTLNENNNIPVITHPKRTTSQVVDIVKHPKFRLYVIIMALNWFATALVYDGLTYLNNYIGTNIFFNWIAMNMIELPAQFVCYIVLSRYGRRLTTSVTLVLVGFILLLTCLDSIEVIGKIECFKLVLFVLAKFIITQSYSAVILHAPELFPTNLRSFGYGISLFSGKVTACISPMISIYLGKIYPILPSIIYGLISVVCGCISLYVPETLNRPLPNSIEDVLKWPRTLTPEEWKAVDELNSKEFNMNKLKKCLRKKMCCKKEILNTKKRVKPDMSVTISDSVVVKGLPSGISQYSSSLLILSPKNQSNEECNELKSNTYNKSSTLPSSLSSSSATTSDNKKDIKLLKVVYSSSNKSSSDELTSSADSLSSESKFELISNTNNNTASSVNSFEEQTSKFNKHQNN